MIPHFNYWSMSPCCKAIPSVMKSVLIRKVASLEGDNLAVFYYFNAFLFLFNQVKHIEDLNLIIHLMKLVTMPTILYQPQERNTLSVNSTKIISTPIYHSMTFIKVKPRIKLITKKTCTNLMFTLKK